MKKAKQKNQPCISVTKRDVIRMIDSNAQALGVSTKMALKRVRSGTPKYDDVRWADISMLDAMLRAE